MFRVFLVLINLKLALSLPEVYGVPPVTAGDESTDEFQPQAAQPVEGRKSSLLKSQVDREPIIVLPELNEEQVIRSLPAPTSTYGVPDSNRLLQESYSHQREQQSTLNERGKSLQDEQVHRTYNLQPTEDISNDEIITNFKPQLVDKSVNMQDYAKYREISSTYGIPSSESNPAYKPYPEALSRQFDSLDNQRHGSHAQHDSSADQGVYNRPEGSAYQDSLDNQRHGSHAQHDSVYNRPEGSAYQDSLDNQRHGSHAQHDGSAHQGVYSRPEGSAYQDSLDNQRHGSHAQHDTSADQGAYNRPEGSAYQDSLDNQRHGSHAQHDSVYNRPDESAHQDSLDNQRHGSHAQHDSSAHQGVYSRPEGSAHQDSVIEGRNYQPKGVQNSDRRYETPVRHIVVYQTHRAPGRADISTGWYYTQPVQIQQTQGQPLSRASQLADNPIVLPMLSNYHHDSPIGSISSTLISKDVGANQRQPAYLRYQQRYREEASSDSDENYPSPQSEYGVPNL